MDFLAHFAQTMQSDADGGGSANIIAAVIITVLTFIVWWRVFQKAKQPGWAAIIPIYNLYILLKLAGRPGWWIILYLIPFVNIIVHIVVSIDVAKAFGKSTAFGVFGLWLFTLIGYAVLAFGDATYRSVPQRA